MEELFKNKTKCTQEEYNIFLETHRQETSFSETIYYLFNTVFFIICLMLAIINKEYILGGIILIGLIIYTWYKLIRPKKVEQKEKQSNKIKYEYTNTFYFYKYYFKVKNQEGEAKITYLKIYKVIEKEKYFYIYLSKDLAFIISKQGFINSNSEEFSKFIRNKVKMKYKIRQI